MSARSEAAAPAGLALGGRPKGEDAAAVLVFGLLALLPFVFSGYVIYILPQYMLFGILAMSLAILWGFAGILSFGQAAFFAIGGYAMGLTVQHEFGINPAYVGIVLAVVAAGAVAVVVGYFLFSAGVRAAYFVIATLALSIIVEQIAKSFSDITGGWNGLYVSRMSLTAGPLLDLSLYDDVPMYYFILVVVALVYAAVSLAMRSRFGKIVSGIRENEDRMLALGYNISLYKTLAVGLSGLLAGLSGALYTTHAEFMHPSLAGVLFSTEIVVWVAIGGRHSLLGAFAGGIVVASISNYLNSITPQYWQLVQGIIFILVIVLFRGGLAGLVERLATLCIPKLKRHDRAAAH